MKRKKYGEKTVVIRIPEGKKEAVMEFLKTFEVLDSSPSHSSNSDLDAIKQAYARGFNECLTQWENYNLALPFILSAKKSQVKLLSDFLNKDIPDSMFPVVFRELLDNYGDTFKQLDSSFPALLLASAFLDRALDKANERLNQSNFLLE